MSMSLANKVAIVTGGASGIGLGVVKAFLSAGVKGITIVDRSPESLKSCVEALGANNLLTVVGDVSEEATVEDYTRQTLDKWGQVDVVVLNAGITGEWHPLHEMPAADFDKVMAVNCRSVFLGLKHGIAAFLKSPSKGQGCSAVVISSVAGLEGIPTISPYTASKFAVRGLAAVASQEYGKYGIRVNAVCPGFIVTPFSLAVPEVLDVAKEKATLKRLGEPEDIANAVLYLSSDAGKFCTGTTLKVDGGVTPWY